VRVTVGGRQTGWYTMGVWASGDETIKRQSVGNQSGDEHEQGRDEEQVIEAEPNVLDAELRVSRGHAD
jgi:hypothetical protein